MKWLILYKMTLFHSLFIKKSKTVLFWLHCAPSSSPGHVKVGEKGFSSPPLQRLSNSLPYPTCLKPRHNPHSFMAYHNDDRGRGDKPSLPLPLINTPSLGGGGGGGGGDERMKRKKKIERKKEENEIEEKKERKKNRGKQRKKTNKKEREKEREKKEKKREKQGRQTPWSSTIFFLYQLRYNTHEPPSLCFLPT